MHGNDKQMRLCIVKLGIVSSIYGVGVEMHIHTLFPCLGFLKRFVCRFWCTHGFINLKKKKHTQNLAFVHTDTFRMKSTESFINETPGPF